MRAGTSPASFELADKLTGTSARPMVITLVILTAFIPLARPVLGQSAGTVDTKQVEKGKSDAAEGSAADTSPSVVGRPDQEKWNNLLPKEGLDGWEVTDFYEHGNVSRSGSSLLLEEGKPLTGITYKKDRDFPTSNYEIELRARRLRGNDFLCGLTFPVGKEFCSFIAGGWGGGLVGLSSIDGADASENSTTTYHDFKNDQWYLFRISVDDEFIRCSIDGKEVVLQERENHQFSTRIEVYSSQPLGLCVFRSKVEVQDFRWRSLINDESGGRPQ
jgi:hypothetical protein